MSEAWGERVLEAVDGDVPATVELLAGLVRIPSVTGSDAEGAIQEDLAARLDAEGLELDRWTFDVEELASEPSFPGIEVPRARGSGLVARLRGTGGGRSLMLACHVDVVPPGRLASWSGDPFDGRVETGRVWGRGACDMKAGLAASLAAVRALRRAGAPLRGDLLLACVQGEEDGGLGTYAMLRRGWTADACVIPEPTGLDIVPANAGALTFRLRVPGLAAHASRRTEGVSALEKAWPVFRAIRDLERRRNVDVDPLMRRWDLPYAIELGTVRGGEWASSVPDEVVMEGRFGVALDEHLDAASAELERAVAECCEADPWLRDHPATVEWWGGRFAPARTPPDGALVARVRAAHVAATGRVPDLFGAPYGSDLRLFTGVGIPALQYGPGDLRLAHAANESVAIRDVVTAARALALLALDQCGTDGAGA